MLMTKRRKFEPPMKTADSSSFNPAKSIVDQMKSKYGAKNQDGIQPKSKIDPPHRVSEESKEEYEDERYKNLDPRMVEQIESEILVKSPEISWDDIAGLDFAKKTIKELIILPLLRPDIFWGIRSPSKGVLLFGPPGTGKTLIGKAIANESKSTFFSISSSTLTSKWVGESEKMVKTLFEVAKIHQPSVIFIDEIDSLLWARNENDQEGSRRIKTEFMVQFGGTRSEQEDRILIIGATNRPEELDEAVRRRLEKRLYIPLPNKCGRKIFLANVIKDCQNIGLKIDMSEEDIDTIVGMTKGYSGADLKSLCTEASMIPTRSIDDISNILANNIRSVNVDDFKWVNIYFLVFCSQLISQIDLLWKPQRPQSTKTILRNT
jgi:fidgetin-like protein 1